jgi:hypothetical protein
MLGYLIRVRDAVGQLLHQCRAIASGDSAQHIGEQSRRRRAAGGSTIAGGPGPSRLALPVGAHAAKARAVPRLANPQEGLAALRAVVRVADTPRRGIREVRAHLIR